MIASKRIAVAGTHSAGKTSFAHELAKAAGIQYIRGDQARDIAADLGKQGKKLDQLDAADQRAMQLRMLQGLSPKERLSYITDGTPLSCIPYGQALMGQAEFELFSQEQSFLSKVHQAASGFDLTFYLPPEIGLELDGFRPPNEEFYWQMDREVRDLLPPDNTKTITGTLEDRVKAALFHLGYKDLPPRSHHIVIEGLPRSGKSSVITEIKEHLDSSTNIFFAGRPPYRPNGLDHVQVGLHDLYKDPIKNREKLLKLFVDTFVYHQNGNETPDRLSRGQPVITDRQKFSIIAMMRALDFSWGELYYATRQLPTSGTVIYLDVDPTTSVERAKSTAEHHNLKTDIEFQSRVSQAYSDLSQQHPEFIVIDANRSLNEVTRDCLDIVQERALTCQ